MDTKDELIISILAFIERHIARNQTDAFDKHEINLILNRIHSMVSTLKRLEEIQDDRMERP